MVGTCTRDDSARAGMTRFTPKETRKRASLAGYACGKELPQCWQKRAPASTAVPHTEQ
jgi:hypothetical protein